MKGVDGGDEPDRIEIELTTHDPRPRPTVGPHGDEPTGDDPPRPIVSPRGRVAALVVGVGLGALALGWVLGNAGGDQTAAESPATTHDASDESAEPDETARVGETLPPAEINTTTTERPRPTTTTLAPIAISTIEVAPQLADRPYELVGVASSDRIVALDLGSGTQTERRLAIRLAMGQPNIWAGRGWVVIPDFDERTGQPRSWLVEDGSEPVEVDIGSSWNPRESETSGRFWRIDDWSLRGPADRAELVDLYGEPLGQSIELPTSAMPWGISADPAGGLVLTAPGGTYSVTTDGASRIVDGELIAIGAERALARRCNQELQCEHVVVDRVTGDMRTIELPEGLPQTTSYFGYEGDLGTIGPDGTTAAIGWFDERGQMNVSLVDLDTAGITPLDVFGHPIVRWTPDGRYVVYLDGGRATALDLASGESFLIADDMPHMNSIAIRPSTD